MYSVLSSSCGCTFQLLQEIRSLVKHEFVKIQISFVVSVNFNQVVYPDILYEFRVSRSHFWRRKWQPTPVFLPGDSQGRGSLVGCCLWGHTESDTTESTQQQQQQQQISFHFNTLQSLESVPEASKKPSFCRTVGRCFHLCFLICHQGITMAIQVCIQMSYNFKKTVHIVTEQQSSLSVTGRQVSKLNHLSIPLS